MATGWPSTPRVHQSAGVLDLSCRSRICLTGADRVRFLHGQVTNDVKKLRVGEGCYAAITTNKGKMESDLNIFCLADELLLDFEPGLTEKISQRLEKFIVADDVQIADVAPHYGLLSVQGPKAEEVVSRRIIRTGRSCRAFQADQTGRFPTIRENFRCDAGGNLSNEPCAPFSLGAPDILPRIFARRKHSDSRQDAGRSRYSQWLRPVHSQLLTRCRGGQTDCGGETNRRTRLRLAGV